LLVIEYECETWSVITLREEYRLNAFKT